MKRLPNDLIGDVRTVVVAGVDVVHAGLHRLPQNCNGLVAIAWRPKDVRAGELHGAVAHSVNGQRCARQREAACEISQFSHFSSPISALSLTRLERLSDQFFTLLPERLSVFRIECIPAYSFADAADRHVVRHDFANAAVLAIATTDFVSWSHHGGPHRSCGSLRNGFPPEGPLTLGSELLIHLFEHRFEVALILVASELGLDLSRMHGGGAAATVSVPLVECNCEQNVCGF